VIITVIKAEIEAEAGWAVGTSDTEAIGLDRELLTDPGGRPWVPPSSLAGSLRAHLARHDADQRLMGSRPPRDDVQRSSDPSPPLASSALWLLGTRARRAVSRADGQCGNAEPRGRDPGEPDEAVAPRTDVVASTAVDPVRRAAVPKSLRYSRVVDEAAVVELYAMLDGELTGQDQELLGSWRPEVGRDRTRGGGLARLRTLGYRAYDLDQPDDLRAWLEADRADGMGRFDGLTPIPVVAASDPPLLRAGFVIASALHVATGSRRGKIAAIRTRGGDPLVPASTWKGLFRSRAGYIIRSCWGEDLGQDAACVSQQGCGQCLLCDLFGSTARRGRIGFRDSTVTQPRRQERSHVAIDRISGGGRDKLLFTDDVVTAGRVTLTITRLGPVAEWERNLLLHVVRDIHDGLIGVGGGAQRGQGTIQLADASHAALTALQPMPSQPPTAEAARD
jgi:CRISPR/Cas system CSM-associated protein Csm3 (group 7 of RAMP superfamily)